MFLLGLVAAPEQVTSQRLSALIQQIMGDATFLSNAGRLQQVIRDTGGFAAAADLLE
jgi:UDP:flavonoid glycosyltransferase YjiC (YdhE family)